MKSALMRKTHKVKNTINLKYLIFKLFVTYIVWLFCLFLNSLKGLVISQQAPISLRFWPTTETRKGHQTQHSTMKSSLCLRTLQTLNSSLTSLEQSLSKDVWIMRQESPLLTCQNHLRRTAFTKLQTDSRISCPARS